MKAKSARMTMISAALVAALATTAPVAQADHHIMQIREVFPGSGGTGDYVELQMLAAGQNLTGGRTLIICNAAATVCNPEVLPANNVASGQDQRRVLIGGPGFSTLFPGITPDYEFTTDIDPAGGAVCFGVLAEPVDCVSWGSFPPNAVLISPTGTPAAAIPNGSSLERNVCRGTPNRADAFDDTNNSSADFALNPSPVPTPNSSAPLTETACGGGGTAGVTFDKKPKKKLKSNKATFRFSSEDPSLTFECRLDKKAFKGCTSPHKVKKLKKGKHTFRVRITGSDAEATSKFRVVD